jgi:hypothetical protein
VRVVERANGGGGVIVGRLSMAARRSGVWVHYVHEEETTPGGGGCSGRNNIYQAMAVWATAATADGTGSGVNRPWRITPKCMTPRLHPASSAVPDGSTQNGDWLTSGCVGAGIAPVWPDRRYQAM